jgi:hypothetical protein
MEGDSIMERKSYKQTDRKIYKLWNKNIELEEKVDELKKYTIDFDSITTLEQSYIYDTGWTRLSYEEGDYDNYYGFTLTIDLNNFPDWALSCIKVIAISRVEGMPLEEEGTYSSAYCRYRITRKMSEEETADLNNYELSILTDGYFAEAGTGRYLPFYTKILVIINNWKEHYEIQTNKE